MRRFVMLVAAFLAMQSPLMADDWKELFNGKDLTGWKGFPELWSVKDGAITGYTKDGKLPKGNSFLIWDGVVKDFELNVKFKIVGGNSGIQYRSKVVGKPEDFVVGGYQADIDGSKGMGFFGILYEERGRGVMTNRGAKVWVDPTGAKYELPVTDPAELLKAIKVNDWNEYVIVAKGNHLTQTINGKVFAETIDFQKDKRAAEGILAFQIHAGMGEMTVQFKDVKLKTLTDAKELTPESDPIPKEAKKK
ncbi:3-keto-disaccharide hydrolase [Zavarzinella formosa]|uniref:3-keto-disaccharide hydrolase n=1 Tax=Zavarzinella formosa TaxID=360055 RepID=UPI0002F08DC2|nr:DUF1080 domain-containing protein [Zavarzinella formosa]